MPKFFYQSVAFDALEVVLQLYRLNEKSKEEILPYFSNDNNIQFIKENYDQLKQYTIKEAILLENIEQRMVALQCFSPASFLEELNAVLLDKQTVLKKQHKWDGNGKLLEHQYEDTYELYKIDGSIFNKDKTMLQLDNIYLVKCMCPSTNRYYHIYVDEEIAATNDAIACIAWTMRINYEPISKELYLNLMYAES